jgi:spore coat protein A, manganese oxidase
MEEGMRGLTRRRFLAYGAGIGGGLLIPAGASWARARTASAFSTPTLPGANIPKFRDPLRILPAMPRNSRVTDSSGTSIDVYQIASARFRQQVLPSGMPSTTVFGYGVPGQSGSFRWPANTIEARFRTPVRVRWINHLVDSNNAFIPHILPVDPTLHWANPPGGPNGVDTTPTFTSTPGPYRGPVPNVVHLHGSERSPQESDGYPDAWFLPDAANIPNGFATRGSLYDSFRQSSSLGNQWSAGNSVYQYPNQQRATMLWFHDHSLGMTRDNVWAGLAGFYALRGGPDDQVNGTLPGPAPQRGDPSGVAYHEIALMIQDRFFNSDGSLFYPDSRAFFDGFTGPYIPGSDIPPIWNAEVFGDAMTVNGKTWPFLNTEQRRYRFRIVNACNARFLILRLSNGMPFWQIGSDGGFLPSPVQLNQLLIEPSARADVIVDFTNVSVGTRVNLINVGPDEPFGGGEPGVDFTSADPNTTGQVMQFRIVQRTSADNSTPPAQLGLPRITNLGAPSVTRLVSLNEIDSQVLDGVGPLRSMLGKVNPDGTGLPLRWHDPVDLTPRVGSTEQWELWDFTEDAHPIHIHVTQFQVINRQPFGGAVRGPEAWETGFKDVVIAYPGEITRVRPMFLTGGLFVVHCHILEHEDNEMMRPMKIG